jgi:hypothetical protein
MRIAMKRLIATSTQSNASSDQGREDSAAPLFSVLHLTSARRGCVPLRVALKILIADQATAVIRNATSTLSKEDLVAQEIAVLRV